MLKRRARAGNLLAFTLFTKSDYQVNWHHKLVCQVLSRFLRKEIKRLMLFQPPRTGKSELSSRRLPAMIHGLFPNDEIMAATYNASLSGDLTTDVQRIMDTRSYQELFPNSRITPEDSHTKWARNSEEHELLPVTLPSGEKMPLRGKYRAQGLGGSFGGRGADWLLIDDPIKNRQDADSQTFRESLWKFYTSTLRTRLEKNGSILLTVTRWHEDDIAARLLALSKSDPDADQWTVISLPAIREDVECDYDPRKPGEPLWPEKFDLQSLMATKASGIRDWTALYQQIPTPEGGTIVQRSHIKFYHALPAQFDAQCQSWDLTFTGTDKSDYVVGTVWGKVGATKYLLDMVRAKMSFTATLDAVKTLSAKWPQATARYVEAAANGQALMDTLHNHISGLIPVSPRTSKVARMQAVSPQFEAGNVLFPDPSIAPWVHDVIEELVAFPHVRHDDICDSISMALLKLEEQVSLDWAMTTISKVSTWR